MEAHAEPERSLSGVRNVFLIGYRGAGKTTVAQILAERLGWNWLDADALLEKRYGLSIASIFADEGEAGFRQKEMVVLEEVCQRRHTVVATGGGVVVEPANRDRLKRSGKVVWLRAHAEALWQRLQTDVGRQRPPLTTGGLAEVRELLQTREPLYRLTADMTLETVGRSPADIATTILASLADLRD